MFATAGTHHIEPELDYKMCLTRIRKESANYKVIFPIFFTILYVLHMLYTLVFRSDNI